MCTAEILPCLGVTVLSFFPDPVIFYQVVKDGIWIILLLKKLKFLMQVTLKILLI